MSSAQMLFHQSRQRISTVQLNKLVPEAFLAPYQRYLVNYLRDGLPFAEVPIRLLFRKRESSDLKDEIETKRKS